MQDVLLSVMLGCLCSQAFFFFGGGGRGGSIYIYIYTQECSTCYSNVVLPGHLLIQTVKIADMI